MFILNSSTLNYPCFITRFLAPAEMGRQSFREVVVSSVILEHISALLVSLTPSFFLDDGWKHLIDDRNPSVRGFAIERFALATIFSSGLAAYDIVASRSCELRMFDSSANLPTLPKENDHKTPLLYVPETWNHKRIDAVLITPDKFVAIQVTFQPVSKHADTRLFFEEDVFGWSIGKRKWYLLWIVPKKEADSRNALGGAAGRFTFTEVFMPLSTLAPALKMYNL